MSDSDGIEVNFSSTGITFDRMLSITLIKMLMNGFQSIFYNVFSGEQFRKNLQTIPAKINNMEATLDIILKNLEECGLLSLSNL